MQTPDTQLGLSPSNFLESNNCEAPGTEGDRQYPDRHRQLRQQTCTFRGCVPRGRTVSDAGCGQRDLHRCAAEGRWADRHPPVVEHHDLLDERKA